MSHGGTDRRILVQGSLRTIECAIRANGSMPAGVFIDGLRQSELRPLNALLTKMANAGMIFNTEQFKQVQGKIYEFKRYQIRIGCFQVGSSWRLTHGFVKKDSKWKKTEIKRAITIMQEDLERDSAGRKKGGKR